MRSKLPLLAAIALVSGFTLFAATRTWVAVDFQEGAAAFGWLWLTGHTLSPALSPIAIAGLAAALALTIAGRVFRRVLGVLVALLGAGVAMIGVSIMQNPEARAGVHIAEVTGISGGSQAAVVGGVELTVWPTLVVAAGGALVVLGLLVLLCSGSWQRAGRKYDAGQDRERVGAARPQGETDRISDWDAQNDGSDPSDEPSDELPR